MKMALVHDWLITEGGSEKVVEAFLKMFPVSDIYTLFYDAKGMSHTSFSHVDIHPSFLQKIPFSLQMYRYLLPFFPLAIEHLDVSEYDMVLSSSHAVAKGVKVREDQLHICYCHTPMRYIWGQQDAYFSPGIKTLIEPLFHWMRKWDKTSSQGVDLFVANSQYVAKRIERAYQRKSVVIYPPVSVDDFFISDIKDDYYITHARLVPYKKIDLLIETFRLMPDKKLLIIGTGPDEKKLKKRATKNVEFLGFVKKSTLATLLSQAKAYLFAAVEDFGIGVVEAQSAGLPVIALAEGGALETVIEGKTGLFFQKPEVFALIEAIQSFEKKEETFNPAFIKSHAQQFSLQRFQEQFSYLIEEKKKEFYENRHLCRWERNASLASFSKQLS